VLAFVYFFTVQNSQAAVFELDLYTLKEPRTITANFFNDYDIFETCEVEIDDAVIKPNAFVEIHSDEFKRLTCTIKGNHGTYTFTYGSEIKRDYWRRADSDPPIQYGLLFDSAAKPLRFDSPQFSTADGVGFYDTEGREEPDGTVNIVGAPFFDPKIHDTYDIPAAILLEPTVVNGVLRERGEWLRSDLVPPGASAALVNGEFSFDEGFYDVDGNSIQGLKLGRFLSFDQKLRPIQVQITQAVFQGNKNVQLVDKRRTAILVDLNINENISNPFDIKMSIIDSSKTINNIPGSGIVYGPVRKSQIGGRGQISFFCGKENNYCDMQDGKVYGVIVEVDPDGIIPNLEDIIGNKEVNANVKVRKTKELVIPNVPIKPHFFVFLGHATDR